MSTGLRLLLLLPAARQRQARTTSLILGRLDSEYPAQVSQSRKLLSGASYPHPAGLIPLSAQHKSTVSCRVVLKLHHPSKSCFLPLLRLTKDHENPGPRVLFFRAIHKAPHSRLALCYWDQMRCANYPGIVWQSVPGSCYQSKISDCPRLALTRDSAH